MCTYPWPFADELALWDELGVRHVGVISAKVDQHGRDAAIAAMNERSMAATTVITANFDLGAPETWDATRAAVNDAIDLAAVIGGCTYFTPGRRDGRSFDELTASLADAVAPCAGYAASRGVRLAIEPSLRTDQSFVHTLRDGVEVAERAGIDVIADLGNCWMERDYEATVRRSGARIAAVQFADALFGTPTSRPRAAARCPATATSPIQTFIEAALDAGYSGAFELEMVGPRIEAEGHDPGAAAGRGTRQQNARGGAVVSRAIVFNGDETWEMRDLPVPDPQPGGAVLRVEATGLCHSDIDHFRGHVHTSWGGEFPSIAGHEIVGRIERIDPAAAEAWGVGGGRPGRRARHRHHPGRVPDLRPRLLGRRGLRSLRRLRRTPGAAARVVRVPLA